LAVEKRRLILGPCDLVDGTPVFDIKPYVPAYDSFPEAAAGWIENVDTGLQEPTRFVVSWSALARSQTEWLQKQWAIDFTARLIELLARDPMPHRTRRIKRRGPELNEIGCGAWKAVFKVVEFNVEVVGIEPAYPLRFLIREGYQQVPDREAQLAFMDHWMTPNP
jgi:hypothetical protein